MNSKRSYLDTLNAGRQRRRHATLEELNRSMEALEQRLDHNREEPAASRYDEPRYGRNQPYGQPYESPRASQRPYSEPAYAQRPYEGSRGYQRPYEEPRPYRQRPAQSFDQPYQSIARDLERMRGQEDGIAQVGKIAGELRGLREELRQQMTAGLQREFQSLRKDIERVYQQAPRGGDNAEQNV